MSPSPAPLRSVIPGTYMANPLKHYEWPADGHTFLTQATACDLAPGIPWAVLVELLEACSSYTDGGERLFRCRGGIGRFVQDATLLMATKQLDATKD